MIIRAIPNILGLLRILATPLMVWLILLGSASGYLWAIILLLLMAISDLLDGVIARRLKVVSPLGIFLDTISDKIFVAGALLPLVQQGWLSAWIALLIIVRDFAVSGLRSFASAEGQVIPAGTWGKQKLVITVTALVWLLLHAHAVAGGVLGTIFGGFFSPIFALWPIPMGLTVFWTLMSGVEYFWNSWALLRQSWSPSPAPPPRPRLRGRRLRLPLPRLRSRRPGTNDS